MRKGLESELWMKGTLFRWRQQKAGSSGGYYRSWGDGSTVMSCTGVSGGNKCNLQEGHMGRTLGTLHLGPCVLHDNCQPEVCILWGMAGMQDWLVNPPAALWTRGAERPWLTYVGILWEWHYRKIWSSEISYLSLDLNSALFKYAFSLNCYKWEIWHVQTSWGWAELMYK